MKSKKARKKKNVCMGYGSVYSIYLLLISKVHSSYHMWWNEIGLPLLLLTSHISITLEEIFVSISFINFVYIGFYAV